MNENASHTTPSEETRKIEEEDAKQHRAAGAEPTPEEEAAAERGKSNLTPEAAEKYEEYLEKAVNVKGEGQVP